MSTPEPGVAGGSLTHTPAIFINYRPDDTYGEAEALSGRLTDHFDGQATIHFTAQSGPRDITLEEIEASGAAGSAVLVLIGEHWLRDLKAAAEKARRVEDAARRELEWALSDWSGDLIPILVNADMPDSRQLPRSIRGICRPNAQRLRDVSFGSDVREIIRRLEEGPADAPTPFDDETEPAQVRPATNGAPPAEDVPEPGPRHYEAVLKRLREGTVVPLLGPNVRGSLPDATEMAHRLADTFSMKRESPDLAEIAQHVTVTEGRGALNNAIRDILATASKPTLVHHFLAGLPKLLRRQGTPAPLLIVSTNYDSALEHAFEAINEPFDHVVYLADKGQLVHFPWGEDDGSPRAITIAEPKSYPDFPIGRDSDVRQTIIVKINGAAEGGEAEITFRDNYVITEDHYIDYLPTRGHLPTQLLDKLTNSHCLFLGYTVHDWNARVLLRRIWPDRQMVEHSWAITANPDIFEERTWGAIGNLRLLAARPTDYITSLRSLLLEGPEQQRTGS